MKKTILLFALITSAILFSQQVVKIEDGKLKTFITNGDNSESNLELVISPETIEKIKQLDDYKTVEADKNFIQKNIEKRNLSDPLLIFLMSKVSSAGFATKNKFKHTMSFKIKEGAQGKIYFSEISGFTISFPFEIQNNLGNNITATSNTNQKTTSIQY